MKAKREIKKTQNLSNGLYLANGMLAYVFERLELDTDALGNKRESWVEYRYYDFQEDTIYHICEMALDSVKFLPVKDKAIIDTMKSRLRYSCENKIAECEPFADILRVLKS
jgi:hypothetical protein